MTVLAKPAMSIDVNDTFSALPADATDCCSRRLFVSASTSTFFSSDVIKSRSAAISPLCLTFSSSSVIWCSNKLPGPRPSRVRLSSCLASCRRSGWAGSSDSWKTTSRRLAAKTVEAPATPDGSVAIVAPRHAAPGWTIETGSRKSLGDSLQLCTRLDQRSKRRRNFEDCVNLRFHRGGHVACRRNLAFDIALGCDKPLQRGVEYVDALP